MMKKLYFTLLLILPVFLSAQNYTNICTDGPAFYKRLNLTSVKAYNTTSKTIVGNGDTIFYSFPTLRDTLATCLDTTKGSILGRKVYRRQSDTYFLFFNKLNDTIFVNTKALLNDSWLFARLTPGVFLEATVVFVGQDTVMGVLDEVKKVELQAKRNDGTPQASPWNGKYFIMSKKYGLARTFDMNLVPFDTTHYTLVGKKKPVIGIQDFGWKDIYNFNIGDVMHYSGYITSYIGNPNSTWKEIQTCIGKTSYGSGPDSIIYKFDRCRSTVSTPGGHVYFRDTITAKYKFNVLNNDSSIMRFPDQFVRRNIYASQFDRFMNAMNDRQTKKITEDRYRFMNNCFVLPQGSVTVARGYSEGLGLSEYFRGDSDGQEFNKLVYFKKGTESWGNMVGTECSPVLDADNKTEATPSVRISPNPMKEIATIILDGNIGLDQTRFTLYNHVGREIINIPLVSAVTSLERNGVKAGMYIWVVTTKTGKTTGKLILE